MVVMSCCFDPSIGMTLSLRSLRQMYTTARNDRILAAPGRTIQTAWHTMPSRQIERNLEKTKRTVNDIVRFTHTHTLYYDQRALIDRQKQT